MRVNSLQEYRDFVQQHNIPLDTIRFALGEDKGHEPRWFYIYKDRFTGEWVVAKNKSDGSTAERYRGNDEAKACQILFDKMQEEFDKRQPKKSSTAINQSSPNTAGKRNVKKLRKSLFMGLLSSNLTIYLIIFLILFIYSKFFYEEPPKRPGQGYYKFQHTYDDGLEVDDLYYYLDDSWYYYDDEYDDWYVDSDFDYDYDYVDDYFVGSYYSSLDGNYDGDASDFWDTSYYQNYVENRYNNSGNDSYDDDDDSWDSYDWDDWDSNDSDWDSDW